MREIAQAELKWNCTVGELSWLQQLARFLWPNECPSKTKVFERTICQRSQSLHASHSHDPLLAWAQTTGPAGTPVQMIVTLGHHYGHEPPALTRDDLTVTQRFDPLPVTNLVPLRGDRAALELFLLVDNCSSCEPGNKFEELRRFIDSHHPRPAVGIATSKTDGCRWPRIRRRIVNAPSRLSTLPPAANPPVRFSAYRVDSGWPQGASRRAVLMISNGIDPAANGQLQDPSAEAAIEAAQRAGVTVYAIYHPSADYLATDSSKIYTGQVQLAHVAVETGGEAYFLGFGPLPSLAPFLADIADHLANQYLLEFLASPAEGPGDAAAGDGQEQDRRSSK